MNEVDPIYNENKMLRNGQWQMMTEPINYDRPVSGVGLAASLQMHGRKLIPMKKLA